MFTFYQQFGFESGFDGGVLEASVPTINSGAYTDVTSPLIGATFGAGGYTGTITNPSAGTRAAWTGSNPSYTQTSLNLGPNVAGQIIQLRFRMTSDGGVASTGWWVDTTQCTCCVIPAPPPPPTPAPPLACSTIFFTQNFDAVTAPTLPSGWSALVVGPNVNPWVTVNTNFDTSPNAAFGDGSINPGGGGAVQNYLISPPIYIQTTSAELSFRQRVDLTTTEDGGVLEVSAPTVNGGAYTDIITAGGSFLAGNYNEIFNSINPLVGQPCWSGNIATYFTTRIALGPNIAWQTVTFRFRLSLGDNIAKTGWWVDTISLCRPPPLFPSPTPTPTPVFTGCCNHATGLCTAASCVATPAPVPATCIPGSSCVTCNKCCTTYVPSPTAGCSSCTPAPGTNIGGCCGNNNDCRVGPAPAAPYDDGSVFKNHDNTMSSAPPYDRGSFFKNLKISPAGPDDGMSLLPKWFSPFSFFSSNGNNDEIAKDMKTIQPMRG